MGIRISTDKIKRFRIRVEGIVQGVGFRPFIYRLAQFYGHCGFVLNDVNGVLIEIQNENLQIEDFCQAILTQSPKASKITNINYNEIPILNDEVNFVIKHSNQGIKRQTLISPDLAICEDCKQEIKSISDRRYLYAFTNCTNCGPRFSIVEDIPYDRANTTMKNFIMCGKCQSEYDNPLDRRFHAQPNACELCGPQYSMKVGQEQYSGYKSIEKAYKLIKSGHILAVKGIGGYHLVCDAKNNEAVQRLRNRKNREAKALAVMTTNLDIIKQFARVSVQEEQLLSSTAAPIVLLAKNKQYDLAEAIAPNNAYIGVMLAYAPIHYLLLSDDDVFVMTSANLSDEPIIYENNVAKDGLKDIADYILHHDRPIQTRVDDSVMRVFKQQPMMLRRSRGFAPSPILLADKWTAMKGVLAFGPELKNTFCITKQNQAFMSQHIGDLENLAVNTVYKNSIDLFKRLFDIEPSLLVCDKHPEYFSTKLAKLYAKEHKLPLLEVQHHHAHIASVMAEHDLSSQVIGISLDGTGYGDDGNIWGGEFFIADLNSYKRMGHFQYMPLPSGAKAVKEPWRLGLWIAHRLYGESLAEYYPYLLKDNYKLLLQATQAGFNAPLTSSLGRIFDVVASLLDICQSITYEGQAAIELERYAIGAEGEFLPYDIINEDNQYIIDVLPLYSSIYELLQNKGKRYVAMSFHMTIAKIICEMIERIYVDSGITDVVLSGGVCQNTTLLTLIYQLLDRKYTIYLNNKVPTNDGGIALGQVAIALSHSKDGLI